MISPQTQPIPPETFDGVQGQIDALLASLVAVIQVIPEQLQPALQQALATNQVLSRETALKEAMFSDEYLDQHDRVCGAVWRLGNLGVPPIPFR